MGICVAQDLSPDKEHSKLNVKTLRVCEIQYICDHSPDDHTISPSTSLIDVAEILASIEIMNNGFLLALTYKHALSLSPTTLLDDMRTCLTDDITSVACAPNCNLVFLGDGSPWSENETH